MRRWAAVAVLLSGCAARQLPTSDKVPTAIVGARVFDGETVLEKATVVFAGDRILSAGPSAGVPEGALVLDGSGKTVLPGLIDAHFHMLSRQALASSLAFGVTTVLDHHGPGLPAIRKEQGEAGSDTEADVRGAIQIVTAPGGLHAQRGIRVREVSTADECKAAVDALVAQGADWVKLVIDDGHAMLAKARAPTLSAEVAKACVDEAHARGKKAVAHATSLSESKVALEAGVDGLVHGVVDAPLDEAFLALAKARSAFVVPTLGVELGSGPARQGPSLLKDAALQPYLMPFEDAFMLNATFPTGVLADYKAETLFGNALALQAAGVPVLAGTDNGNPGVAAGSSLHGELELLVRAGLTPVQALQAATSAPARAFGLADRGRIAPGLRADLLVVDGDPTKDITATRNIWAIFKRGKAFDRAPTRARADVERQALQSYEAKDFKGEEAALAAWLQDHPNDVELLYQLACARSMGGQREAALAALEAVVKLVPGIQRRAAVDSDFAGLKDDPAFKALGALPAEPPK
jgi:imidazolonepropionase-like amidohydrolase